MKNFRLNRRTFLGTAGTSVALPLLEAMLPSGKSAFAQEGQSTRMLAYYVPCGIHMAQWRPAQTGSNFTLSPILAPLESVKDDILVLSNVANRPATPQGNGDHASGTGSFLTATNVRKTEGSDILNGISVDQVAAARIGNQTKFASLELGLDGGGSTGGCDSGYSCAYARNIAWIGPQRPLPKITEPRQVFDRLFQGIDTNQSIAEREKRNALNKSVLDYVLGDIRKLSQRLGSNDRAKLDEYFTSVEQLETNLTANTPQDSCNVIDRPEFRVSDVRAKIQLMSDLMVLAFECDLTRIQTFMLGNAGSQRRYDFLGITEGHHTISHHQRLQRNLDNLQKINLWEIEQFAYLINKLKSTQDVLGGNLLENSVLFLSSEISDGDRHNHNDMPVLLAGQAKGYFSTGKHVNFSQEESFGNVFMSMLEAMGTPVNNFGDDGRKTLSL